MKTIYLLIGPKGSGKTYVGKLLEKRFKIRFLSVEHYFLKVIKEKNVFDEDKFRNVWLEIEKEIEKHFLENNNIIFESIGIFNSFKDFLERLQSKFVVKLIQIKTPLNMCVDRIGKREFSEQVQMSEDNINKVNKMALKEKYVFDFMIDNESSSDEEILEIFQKFL